MFENYYYSLIVVIFLFLNLFLFLNYLFIVNFVQFEFFFYVFYYYFWDIVQGFWVMDWDNEGMEILICFIRGVQLGINDSMGGCFFYVIGLNFYCFKVWGV